MVPLDNYVSRVFKKDKDCLYSILTYIDIDEEITKITIDNYVTDIVKNNPILKCKFVEKKGHFFLSNEEPFNMAEFYDIKYVKKDTFDNYAFDLLNKNIDVFLLFCIDKAANKSRVFFKIHHAYADGYKIIKMLTEPILKDNSSSANIIPNFKRITHLFDSLYYFVIATIVLFILNIKILLAKTTLNNYLAAEFT